MITLITGAPGAGKTAALVSMLEHLGKDRAIYAHGIPDLKVPHIVLDDPLTWPDTVPDGAVVIIDEVQTVWRPAGPGQKADLSIQKLETHRHRGLDFYIITQGPNLVHSNVRALVGRHVHLRDIGFFGRWWYEWPETADNCRTGWKTAPLKKKYKLPKHIFGQYKSATQHNKPERSFPKVALVLGAALIGASYLGFQLYTMIQSKIAPHAATTSLPTVTKNGGTSTVTAANAATPAQGYDPHTNTIPAPQQGGTIDERTAYIPRIQNRPETAPAYDHLRQVVNMPLVVGAICTPKRCKCVNQQGVDAGISEDDCREWLKRPPFDPYTARANPAIPGASSGSLGTGGANTPPPSPGNALAARQIVEAQNSPLPSGARQIADAQTVPMPSGSPLNARRESAEEEWHQVSDRTETRAVPGLLPLRLQQFPSPQS